MSSYSAKDITVLEGLEPVRRRPGMYIGGVGSAGLHHLVWEIVDNAVDEAMNGHASHIEVTLHKDGTSITVEDDGRGIPVDKHPQTKTSALEVIFTTLHAGGKFEGQNYKTAGGLHGVGASVVNALSKELIATVKRDGATWEQKYKQGTPVGGVRKIGAARGTGTTVFFRPDSTIFPKVQFDAKTIRDRLEVASYIHKGRKVVFEDETTRTKTTFEHAEGIVEYLRKVVGERAQKAKGSATQHAPTLRVTTEGRGGEEQGQGEDHGLETLTTDGLEGQGRPLEAQLGAGREPEVADCRLELLARDAVCEHLQLGELPLAARLVVVGVRPAGQPVGAFRMTRNINNPDFAPGAYTRVIDKGEIEMPREIQVHHGWNGGPVIFYPSAIVVMSV